MTETFAPAYFYPDNPTVKTDIQKTSLRGGVEKRRERSTPKYVFDLTFTGINDTQANYIIDFFAARSGELEAFNWVDPVLGTVLVRFDGAELNLKKTNSLRWEGGCRLVEVDS